MDLRKPLDMPRIRRSISFDENLLKWIDDQVEGDYRYKDRSHFIEILARQLQEDTGWNFVQTITKDKMLEYARESEKLHSMLIYKWVQNKADKTKVDMYNKSIDPNDP